MCLYILGKGNIYELFKNVNCMYIMYVREEILCKRNSQRIIYKTAHMFHIFISRGKRCFYNITFVWTELLLQLYCSYIQSVNIFDDFKGKMLTNLFELFWAYHT